MFILYLFSKIEFIIKNNKNSIIHVTEFLNFLKNNNKKINK